MSDKDKLLRLFSDRGFDVQIERTHNGDILIVINRINGFRFQMEFDDYDKLVNLQEYKY